MSEEAEKLLEHILSHHWNRQELEPAIQTALTTAYNQGWASGIGEHHKLTNCLDCVALVARGREELRVPLLALIDKAQEFQDGYKYVPADDLLDLLTGESPAVSPLAVELAGAAILAMHPEAVIEPLPKMRAAVEQAIEAHLREKGVVK